MEKFIITGIPRSGTTVISGSVITHPEVLFYGELFSNTPYIRDTEASRITLGAGWKFETALGRGIKPCSSAESSYEYLNDFFSRETPFKALGFKLLYDQARVGPNSDVWSYIAEHPEIKIIRTQRDDLIEIVCSYVRATMTRRWHMAESPAGGRSFIVPPAACHMLLEKFTNIPESARHLDVSHQVLDIPYSMISIDFQGCMSRLYSFIGVDSGVKAVPMLKKIAHMKPDEELANYQELKQHFQNTKFAKYFVY